MAERVGSVTYREAGQDYFERRGLKRSAGVWGLWGLAVAGQAGMPVSLMPCLTM